MKRKARKRNQKRVERYLDPWLFVLGLKYWDIQVRFHDTEKGFKKNRDHVVAMRVWCDWRYLTISISVNLPCVARLSDDDLEDVVLHELVHVLVNEMRTPGIDHEERTVTQLQKAFRWVKHNALEQFGEKKP